MIIVVDSGSTKADWALINAIKTQVKHTKGFNPVYDDEQIIFNEVEKSFDPGLSDSVDYIFYYGAGCWDNQKKKVIQNALGKHFRKQTFWLSTIY